MKHDKFVGYYKTGTIESRNSEYFTILQLKAVLRRNGDLTFLLLKFIHLIAKKNPNYY